MGHLVLAGIYSPRGLAFCLFAFIPCPQEMCRGFASCATRFLPSASRIPISARREWNARGNRHRSLNRFITLAPVTAAYLGSGRLVFPSLAFVLPWTACIRLAVQNAPAGVDTVSTLVSASHFTPACPLLLLSIADFTAGLVDYNPDRRLRSEILPWEECVSNGGGREGFPAVWAIAIFWFASTVPLLQSVMIFFPLLMCQWQVFWVFLCSLVWLPNAMPPPLCCALSATFICAFSSWR